MKKLYRILCKKILLHFYSNISLILNDKYEMQEKNKWHNDTYKDDPTRNTFSLEMGYVDFSEIPLKCTENQMLSGC